MSGLAELLSRAAEHATAGRIDDTLATYRAAISIAPAHPELHYNIGTLLATRGELAAAEASFTEAERLRPGWTLPPLALGHLYFAQAQFADAERAFERALSLSPESVEGAYNLAITRMRLRRWGESVEPLRRARALAPANEAVWYALRETLQLLKRDDEALADFMEFETTGRPSAQLVVAGLESARLVANSDYEAKYLPMALEWPYRVQEIASLQSVLASVQYFDVPRGEISRLYAMYNQLQQSKRAGLPDLAARPRNPNERIRIGYLSGDFRGHVMGHLLYDIITRHDGTRYAIHAYSLGFDDDEDVLTARLVDRCESFVRLAGFDDRAAAQRIAEDRLDLLVDTMGHSSLSRPDILLYKPAPVIVTHLGYHGCIGLEQVDYKLTDAHSDLRDAGRYQIEAPLAIEGCVLPVRRVAPASQAVATRQELGIAADTVVFGAFVGLSKLSPRCLALWRQILERVSGALLAFSPLNESERPAYTRRLAGMGIAPERMVFVPATRYYARDRTRYGVIDIVLDTLPYTGGDTTAVALDMAVPVVTRVGERHAERMSYSLLAHLGVTDTVAASDDEYVAIACRLADDRAWRQQISTAIRVRLPQSGLADMARYTRSLETAYGRALALKWSPAQAD